VTPETDLSTLSHAEKDALIRSLLPFVGQLDTALARIAELEKRLAALERPSKNPDNSSLPPARGQKPDRPAGDKPPRKSRPGVGRALEPSPDRIVDARLDACPHCAAAFPVEQQTPQQVYDRIELPPIKPDVTRVRGSAEAALAAARVRSRRLRPDWSLAPRSASRSPPWWYICITPMPLGWNGWPP
jgi:transposase